MAFTEETWIENSIGRNPLSFRLLLGQSQFEDIGIENGSSHDQQPESSQVSGVSSVCWARSASW